MNSYAWVFLILAVVTAVICAWLSWKSYQESNSIDKIVPDRKRRNYNGNACYFRTH